MNKHTQQSVIKSVIAVRERLRDAGLRRQLTLHVTLMN